MSTQKEQPATGRDDDVKPINGEARMPKFAEWMRGIYASPGNPQRDGMYVRTIFRTSRVNKGFWYELTDGNGNFYQYRPQDTVFI